MATSLTSNDTPALIADAREAGVADTVFEDAKAAAVLLAMNTTYYRFTHLVGKESYKKKPSRLRMTWAGVPDARRSRSRAAAAS